MPRRTTRSPVTVQPTMLPDTVPGCHELIHQLMQRLGVLEGICSPPLPRYKRMPASRCASGGVMQVDVLGHEAGRADVSDPASNGLMDKVVGHPSLHLAGLHR